MKSLFLLVALLFAVTLGSTVSMAGKSQEMKRHRAVITFATPVKLQGVMLKGEYLFVHDDAAMMRGEACTFVYQGSAENANKLVAKFHCIPVQRTKVASFTLRTAQLPDGTTALTEFQFNGDTESHQVPAN